MSNGKLPAYPTLDTAPYKSKSNKLVLTNEGINIRDYFASHALATIRKNDGVLLSPRRIAEIAYEIADAMLEQREVEPLE